MNSKKKLFYYYYLVIDLECSSSQDIPLDIQLEKLEKLRLCVNKIINSSTNADSLNNDHYDDDGQHLYNKIKYINDK